ncbi:MAG TPA: ATP-binding protein [Clostridia bacterium]|nr:ATP-binding protein [Clostridia bacterium]
MKSFHDEAILDFVASNIDEHGSHVFEKNNNSILPLVAIYGANAAGKTNLLSAFTEMCEFIKTSTDYNEDFQKYFFLFSSFIYDTTKFKAPLEFEVTMALDYDYRYGFSVSENSEIETEYLELRKSPNGVFFTIFDRKKGEKVQLGKTSIISKEEKKQVSFVVDFIREKELLLTMLGRRQRNSKFGSLSRYAALYQWFSDVQSCPECIVRDKNYIVAAENTPLFDIFSDKEALKSYLGFVQKADPTIINLSLESEDEVDPTNSNPRRLLAHRRFINLDESIGDVTLPTFLDSSGTQYIMQAYPIILQALQNGGVLVADEIDRSLHPSLLLDVINLFTNPETNPNHAQLICTMHNVIIMDKRFMRRDEIWFVEKNSSGESSVYSLADYNDVRNDADFCKNYILGRYGAVPVR